MGFWASIPLNMMPYGLGAEFELAEGDEIWTVLGSGEVPANWNCPRAEEALTATTACWQNWAADLTSVKVRSDTVRRSALTVQLLSFAPTGAPLGSPVPSLPERIGRARNFDYRYSWVRAASLSVALLSMLGQTGEARRFFDWLENLQPGKTMPLQIVYRIDGGKDIKLVPRKDLAGYRVSVPVQLGNVAADMVEIEFLWISCRRGIVVS